MAHGGNPTGPTFSAGEFRGSASLSKIKQQDLTIPKVAKEILLVEQGFLIRFRVHSEQVKAYDTPRT